MELKHEFGWGDGQQPEQEHASEVTTPPPTATTTTVHPLEGMRSSVAPESSSVPHSAGMEISGMRAAKILFLDLFSITSGMEFGGASKKKIWACVYQVAQNYS